MIMNNDDFRKIILLIENSNIEYRQKIFILTYIESLLIKLQELKGVDKE